MTQKKMEAMKIFAQLEATRIQAEGKEVPRELRNILNIARSENLMRKVSRNVMQERFNQIEKWGIQRHSMGDWLKILIEEVGEVAQAMQKGFKSEKETDSKDLYKELVQVAAVAQAIAEHVGELAEHDRNTKNAD